MQTAPYQEISSTLQILLVRFHGQVLIPFASASESIGIPGPTARNMLSGGTYPVKTVKIGSRRFIHINDLANFVESLCSKSSKSKRGRPTKASKFHAEQGMA